MSKDLKGNPMNMSDLIETREQESLWSMAILRKFRTGLPVNVWVEEGSENKKRKHGNRIKFQRDRGDRPVSHNFVTMTISDEPEVIGKHELSSKEIQQLKDFVIRNKELLNRLDDGDIDIGVFLEQMR